MTPWKEKLKNLPSLEPNSLPAFSKQSSNDPIFQWLPECLKKTPASFFAVFGGSGLYHKTGRKICQKKTKTNINSAKTTLWRFESPLKHECFSIVIFSSFSGLWLRCFTHKLEVFSGQVVGAQNFGSVSCFTWLHESCWETDMFRPRKGCDTLKQNVPHFGSVHMDMFFCFKNFLEAESATTKVYEDRHKWSEVTTIFEDLLTPGFQHGFLKSRDLRLRNLR